MKFLRYLGILALPLLLAVGASAQVSNPTAGTSDTTHGGTGLSAPAAHSLLVTEGAGPFNQIPSPSANGYYICGFNVTGGIQVDPSCSLSGVPVNAQSASYSMLYSDRASYIKFSGGTTATLTLPQITGNIGNNFPFVVFNGNSGNLTIQANAADKINNSAIGGTQVILPNWFAFVYSDSSSAPGNWWSIIAPSLAALGANCGDATHALNWSTTAGYGCQAITATAAAGGSSGQLQWNNATALGGISGWTTNGTTTLTGGSTSVLDLSAMAPTSGLKLPSVAGAIPVADGFIGINLTNHTLVWGSGGTTTVVGAAAATSTGTSTICATSKWVSTVSSLAAPTCTQPAASDLTVAALANGITATSQSAKDNSTKVATTAYVDAQRLTCGGTSSAWDCKEIGWAFGDVATGSTLTTSEVGYITVPFACTISGYHIMADAGTVTIKTARVNGGTALPTVASNSISTSGVSLSTGTKVDSTTVTDFTSTAIAANDTLGFFITAVATAKQITFQLDCAQ